LDIVIWSLFEFLVLVFWYLACILNGRISLEFGAWNLTFLNISIPVMVSL
jgi:hypothetical protein